MQHGLSNDSQFIAECKLIDLTEIICIIHGKKRQSFLLNKEEET